MAESNNKPRYKLSRLKKAGIAIGLTLAVATTAFTGGMIKIMYDAVHPTTINQSSYQTDQIEVTNDYIDTIKSNELKVYDEDASTTSITLSNYNYLNFMSELDTGDYTFDNAKYYGLEESLALYQTAEITKSTNSDLLDTNGLLDANKLLQKVKENNEVYMQQGKNSINAFYTDLSSSDMTKICTLITEVVNSKFNNIEINKVANTLTQLTMFKNTGSASNAYITNNLTFVYNPSMTGMYADVKEITGETDNPEEILKSVIVHEVMHLLEYSANDNNSENGIEAGICRMYNIPNQEQKVPVDSLWNTWLLEAAAELGMSDYMNISPGTYAKKISYVRSYNLSRFNDLELETQGLEDVTFNHTLEESYRNLELNTSEEQREFLNFLYSIEITQSDPNDFWENYTSITGITPTETEKTSIRMDIRTDAVKYLTRNFYQNLADSIYEGNVTDLDTAFYLMRNWELDTYNHLEYTKTSALPHAEEFILWHNEIQTQFFQAIAESNGLTQEQVTTMYEDYNLQANVNNEIFDNCNLNNYSAYTSSYITTAKTNYSTANFTRNNAVTDYINTKNTSLENTQPTK